MLIGVKESGAEYGLEDLWPDMFMALLGLGIGIIYIELCVFNRGLR